MAEGMNKFAEATDKAAKVTTRKSTPRKNGTRSTSSTSETSGVDDAEYNKIIAENNRRIEEIKKQEAYIAELTTLLKNAQSDLDEM